MHPSQLPPSGLPPSAVPMFVGIGWDDNGFSGLPGSGGTGGISWAADMARARRNPTGVGNPESYDGAPVHMSFYLTSSYGHDDRVVEEGAFVRKAWHTLLGDGHELGNHTRSHHDGAAFDGASWREEIVNCAHDLERFGLVGNRRTSGFRTPFLRYNDATFAAVSELGFVYDSSIEEGFQPDQDGTNYCWPYRLDQGSPGHRALVDSGEHTFTLSERPGLWEMPAYAVIVPPDELCSQYSVSAGLRARLQEVQPYFDVHSGKITGFDYNLWVMFAMTRAEFVATLKYTLDLRLAGNRAPFLFGAHSDYYSSKYTEVPRASLADRQLAFEEFLDHALSKPEVRVVSLEQILAWIQRRTDPAPYGSCAIR